MLHDTAHYNLQLSALQQTSYPIEVQIPSKAPAWAKEGVLDLQEGDTLEVNNPTLEETSDISSDVTEDLTAMPAVIEKNIGDIPYNPLAKHTQAYQKLLEIAGLWHIRLGHLGLDLLKKTSLIVTGIPNLTAIKEKDFFCLACYRAKATRRPSKKPIASPLKTLEVVEGDTFKIAPTPYNRKPIGLILVDRKTRYRWVIQLPNKEGPTLEKAVIG